MTGSSNQPHGDRIIELVCFPVPSEGLNPAAAFSMWPPLKDASMEGGARDRGRLNFKKNTEQ